MFKVGDKVVHRESRQVGVIVSNHGTSDGYCLVVYWQSRCEFHGKACYYSAVGKVWTEDLEPAIRLCTPLEAFLAGDYNEEDT